MLNKPECYQNELVDEINEVLNIPSSVGTVSEMTYKERCFLNGVVRQVKPKKVLELGVSAGGSSALILNAIKDTNAQLYSVDYNEKWVRDSTKPTGFIIDECFSQFKDKWQLFAGGTAARFMEQIGGDIDLCLIDTAHANPGEFLDFLIVLPYLKKNAVLVLHDTCLHACGGGGGQEWLYTNAVLFSCLKGKKFTFNENFFHQYANIGACILDESQDEKLLDYLYLLTLPWRYAPSDLDIAECQSLFAQNYGAEFADRFLKIMLFNKDLFLKRTVSKKYFKHRVLTTLVSLVPSRKLRRKLYRP